jgi:hypothetical protein
LRVGSFILISIGWLLIAFNALAYIGKFPKLPDNTEAINKVAFYIGYNLPLIVGLILLGIGYPLRKKAIEKSRKQRLMDDFLNDKNKT